MVPDDLERIEQDIAEQEFLVPEEKIAGIDRTVRQDAEFRGSGRTSRLCELGIAHVIGDETGAEDRADIMRAKLFFNDGYELVKRNSRVKVLAVQGVAMN